MKQKMFLGASNLIFENATQLKRNMTLAETILWGHLKGKQLGVKFRRQHPLGIYIADFYCHEHKIVIELDGSIHNLPEIAQAERSVSLTSKTMVSKSFVSKTNIQPTGKGIEHNSPSDNRPRQLAGAVK